MTDLLFLVGSALWPQPLIGGQLRSLRVLESLCRRHDVHVIARISPSAQQAPGDDWLPLDARPASLTIVSGLANIDAHWLLKNHPWGSRRTRFITPFTPGVPSLFKARLSVSYLTTIRQARERLGDIVVWAFDLAAAEAAARCGFTRVLVDLDDFEADIWLSEVNARPASLSRELHRFEALRARRFERSAAERFVAIAVAKSEDVEKLSARHQHRIKVVPNGVDGPAPGYVRKPERGSLLFVGSLAWNPNTDAIRSLLTSIFPRIREQIPYATLTIAGRGPIPRELVPLLSPGVEIVESPLTLDAVYSRAEMTVQPVRYGSGTRIKAIDAMAHDVPIVATDFCVGGLGAVPGEHYVRATSDDDFVAEVVALHNDPDRRAALAANGQQLYSASFTWEAALRNVEAMVALGASRD